MALWKQSDDDFISQKRKEKNTYQKPKSTYAKTQNSKQTDIDIDKLYGYKEKVQTGKGKYIFLIAFVAIFMFGMFKPMIGSQLKINQNNNSDTGGYTYITSGFELKSDVYLVNNSYLLFLYSYPTIIYSSEKDPLDVYENHYALIENDSTNKKTAALSCFSGHYLNLKEATSESYKDYDKIWKILDYNGSYRSRIKMLNEEQNKNMPLISFYECEENIDTKQNVRISVKDRKNDDQTSQEIPINNFKSISLKEMDQLILDWQKEYGFQER